MDGIAVGLEDGRDVGGGDSDGEVVNAMVGRKAGSRSKIRKCSSLDTFDGVKRMAFTMEDHVRK